MTDPIAHLSQALNIPPSAQWAPLGGGRSNRIWQVTRPDTDPVVVKVYSETRGNALFPNDPDAEALALTTLGDTAMAPRLLSDTMTDLGRAIVYQFIKGDTGPTDAAQAARALRKLHDVAPPDGLRRVQSGSLAILKSARAFEDGLADKSALTFRPTVAPINEGPAVFLHGDPVPANMICNSDGLVLIDWQCPGVGDACEDLFVFLSPAMQALYGQASLSEADVERFLSAYDDWETAFRYRAMAPLLHWRMAVYCLWMAENGAPDYRACADLEIAALTALFP